LAGYQYRVLAQTTVADTWDYSNNGNELVPGTFAFPVVTAKSERVYIADVSGIPSSSNLTANAVSANQSYLSRTDNSGNEDGFKIERSDDAGLTWNVIGDTTTPNVKSFSDLSVLPASFYQYRVFAYNLATNSLASNIAFVTTPDVAPAAPDTLTTTSVTSSQLDLAWADNSLNESGFVVERSTDGRLNFSQVGLTATDFVTFSDTFVVPGVSYLYRVFAFNANGNSVPSNSVQADVPNALPADPTNLVATSVGASHVGLTWTDNSNNEDGFLVLRSSDNGSNWTQVGQTSANVVVFNDSTVSPATGYLYQVFAFNGVGNSVFPVSLLLVTTTSGTPPAAPSNLVSSSTQSSITLTWVDNATTETGFNLQIATDKNFSQSLQSFSVTANATSFMFNPLAPNNKYFMRVSAFNNAGSSAWVTTVNKTLK
jgi:hypothetical protein